MAIPICATTTAASCRSVANLTDLEADLTPFGHSVLVMEIDIGEIDAADGRRFEAIASGERRRVLSVLRESDSRLSLTELAAELAREKAEATGPGLDSDRVRDLTVELYHRHVPRLADAGLVDFDRSQRTVALTVDVETDDATELLVAEA